MIKSMTGYGRGEYMDSDWKCTAEVKAVNHRYCDISIRMPPIMNPYEDRIKKMLSQDIRRGKVDVYIRIESFGNEPVKIDINAGAADAYMQALDKLVVRYTLSDQVTLAMLASYPDIFMVDKNVTDETRSRIWTVLEKAIGHACAQFNEMRCIEGKVLFSDISAKRDHIINRTEQIKTQLPIAAQEYEKRLKDRIKEVLAQLQEGSGSLPIEPDESRLLVELALYADRACIDEEITRLESHLAQLNYIMNEDDAVGRKLDFLVQELNREVNTIGSKTGDMVISKLVIDMKSDIEKIREQVQNVE